MSLRFDEDGVQFDYPANWRLDREETPNGWTVTLQSPGTAFLMINFDADLPDREQVVAAALVALQSEYPNLDAEERFETLAGQPAFGHDIGFFHLDLTNSCWIRSLYCGRGTLLVLWQMSDLELDTNEAVLRSVCATLTVDNEEKE